MCKVKYVPNVKGILPGGPFHRPPPPNRRPSQANDNRSLVPVPSCLRSLYQLITLLPWAGGSPASQTSQRFPTSTTRPR